MGFFRRPLLTVALFGLLAIACRETVESSYPDLASVRLQGAFTRGWLPAYLPSSATSLLERHNLDSNATLLAFRFDPAEAFIGSAPCVSVAEAEVPAPPRLGRTKWWPRDLLSAPRGGLRLFRCEDSRSSQQPGHAWLALDSARGEAFFWRTSR
mgnify:CR=1 FL=1